MIDITKLNTDDINRKVIYKSIEEGYITSFNNLYVFVCFDKTGRGIAVNPRDLEFMWPNKKIFK